MRKITIQAKPHVLIQLLTAFDLDLQFEVVEFSSYQECLIQLKIHKLTANTMNKSKSRKTRIFFIFCCMSALSITWRRYALYITFLNNSESKPNRHRSMKECIVRY
ncbi:Hypothetical_protein [Hexamita inflata]|uniref:Hypothetical_protein n=1 Tax=Hexamita inflata TaxID=28002 RepID=A0AA86VLU8_9EUKA|nr:Hypothetical protein HINF_LOCUS58053 [Hexamita inflata]